ncbi:MAG: hypothetical protein K1X64_07680 [Myxococcaceae bacterium]|nr:hypothetical protein [Myxococcaceae bacterium]
MKRLVLAAVLAVASFSGCETTRASMLPTPKERVTECEEICTGVGMKLSALVVIMSSAGCVCEVVKTTTTQQGAGGVSGGAIISAAAAAAQASQQRQQQQMRR